MDLSVCQAETQKYAFRRYDFLETIPFGVLVAYAGGRLSFAHQMARMIVEKAFEPGKDRGGVDGLLPGYSGRFRPHLRDRSLADLPLRAFPQSSH
jgi:hypothetical protein